MSFFAFGLVTEKYIETQRPLLSATVYKDLPLRLRPLLQFSSFSKIRHSSELSGPGCVLSISRQCFNTLLFLSYHAFGIFRNRLVATSQTSIFNTWLFSSLLWHLLVSDLINDKTLIAIVSIIFVCCVINHPMVSLLGAI